MSTDTIGSVRTGVLIVGGGPTGLTLANVLGYSNVPFMLVDQKPSTIGEPRAVSIDDESLRTMQSFELDDAVMQDVVQGYGVHYFDRPGGTCFARVEPTASEYGFPRRNAFRQPLFEATLRHGAERFACGEIKFAHTLESFDQDAHGVTALVRSADGERLTVHTRFLVACDGGRSPIREKLGIRMVGSTFKSRWLVIDTERDTDPFSQMRVYCDSRRPIVDVPGPHNTRRYEILIHPHESTDEALKEATIANWLRPLRGETQMHVVRKTVYTFHARVAERWQAGRVFLAGDAAHLTPPYAGQGMNSGVRDAHNLGWKLAAVLGGQMPQAILTSYEPERRKHAWALIRLALNLGIVMAPGSRASAFAWQRFFRVIRFIPPVRDFFVQMKFKPKPRFNEGLLGPASAKGKGSRGRMLPQPLVEVRCAGDETVQTRKLDDLIGHGFAIVQYGDENRDALEALNHPLWEALRAARIRVLPPGAVVPANDAASNAISVVACTDLLEKWLGAEAGRQIVVRPDRYVAGTFDMETATAFADRYAAMLGVDIRASGEQTRHLESVSTASTAQAL